MTLRSDSLLVLLLESFFAYCWIIMLKLFCWCTTDFVTLFLVTFEEPLYSAFLAVCLSVCLFVCLTVSPSNSTTENRRKLKFGMNNFFFTFVIYFQLFDIRQVFSLFTL